MQYNTNLGFSNYNAATLSVKKRFSNGLQFQSSYVYTRNLSNADGAATTTADQYTGEFGGMGFESKASRPRLRKCRLLAPRALSDHFPL